MLQCLNPGRGAKCPDRLWGPLSGWLGSITDVNWPERDVAHSHRAHSLIRMIGSIPPLSFYAFIGWTGTNLLFFFCTFDTFLYLKILFGLSMCEIQLTFRYCLYVNISSNVRVAGMSAFFGRPVEYLTSEITQWARNKFLFLLMFWSEKLI